MHLICQLLRFPTRIVRSFPVSGILSSSFSSHSKTTHTFVDLVFANFDSFADKTAIVDYASGLRYSFSDLRRITGQVASGLAKRGFGKGHVLSLFGSNVIENAPIAYGTVVTGGTLHLVKPVASPEELRFHFDLVAPNIIVTTANCAERVLEAARAAAPDVQDIFVIGGAVSGCRHAEELLEDPGDANPWGQVEIDAKEDVAVLMQTGGTTGMSKTVMTTHEAIKLAIIEMSSLEPSTPDDELSLGYIPFNHVFSFALLYSAWLRLGCGVVNLDSYTPETILRAIEEHKVTRMGITPVAVQSLINCPYFEKANLSSLVELKCGGAAMNTATEKHVLTLLSERAPNAVFEQAYGMTEITGAATKFRTSRDVLYKHKVGSVGFLKADMELQVVSCDDQRRPCRPGEAGEILLRSQRIMKGYLKNEAATRKVVIDGWYVTGDYGYFDADGYIYVMDRVEDIIKMKEGHIVPTHVEGVLRSHPDIIDCAVVGITDDKTDAAVMAFVVKRSGSDITEAEVQLFASETLASHEQLTGGVRFVEAIPKSPAGKMLRRLLTKDL